jgi:hypothetical protein
MSDLIEPPHPEEVVGFLFDGDMFCRNCYGGKDKSNALLYKMASIHRDWHCFVCSKRLSEIPE